MRTYPITQISKQQWDRKVTVTYMYSIPAEDEALPVIEELLDILNHLLLDPLQRVLTEECVEYFFNQVFPPVCQKILKSRYFKSHKVLNICNQILEKSSLLVLKYINYAEKYSSFAEIWLTVFSTDEYYYKTNNQFSDQNSFLNEFSRQNRKWVETLKEGDKVDVLMYSNASGKATWTQGIVETVKITRIKIRYLLESTQTLETFDKDTHEIAPYLSKSKQSIEWRQNLKIGDLVDVEESYGGWYNGTIVQNINREGYQAVKVDFKVYSQKGNKKDQNGYFYGLADTFQIIEISSPKIQPFCSILKQKTYQSLSKSLFDTDDLNDLEFEFIGDQLLYAIPRKKYLSEFLYKAINHFGREGGFTKPVQYLQNNMNITFLSIYVKAMSGISPYIHKKIIRNFVKKLRPIIQNHMYTDNEQFLKQFSKDKSEMLFSGFKSLQKRIYSIEAVYEYENTKKMKLVDKCLQSETLKRKLQGLNQLKDIVRSLTYSNQRSKAIKKWIIQQKLFDKIYFTNSHVQLIKKSQDFFRYLVNQTILEVDDLKRLYKIAQKGDYESRISLYKLFQQVSHIFKKPHVDFLIDTILQSEQAVVLNEDIDLLNQMSKFSNYFPKDKVRNFFESIILGDNQIQALYQYATKKYCQIVAKGYEMKSCRRDIIHSFLSKLMSTQNIHQVCKVLKGIFEGVGVGQYGKKELNQILSQQKIDQVVILALRSNKEKINWEQIVTQILNLSCFIYKISYKIKIHIPTLKAIWQDLSPIEEKRNQYYRWSNQLLSCEQGIGDESNLQQFEEYINELFPLEQFAKMTVIQFNLCKNLFLQLNKKYRYITIHNSMKEVEYRRKVEMSQLRLYGYLLRMIYDVQDREIYIKSLDLFLQIYNAKENEQTDLINFFKALLVDLEKYKKQQSYCQVEKTLILINILIDNSEKKCELDIPSLQSKQKAQMIHLTILNEISYVSDIAKKKDIVFSRFATLLGLKKYLAIIFGIETEQVKLCQEKQIPDYFNSRILKDVPININEPITIHKRYNSYYSQDAQLLLNNKLCPKALRCFKIIFQKYSTDGLMSHNHCHDFTSVCLGSFSKRHDDKIANFYEKYDDDKDDFLTFENFLAFFEDAAVDNKQGTVWSNLKSFGVNGDFRFNDEMNQPLNDSLMPRKLISECNEFYQGLMDLLSIEELASLAYNLLERLPISNKIYNKLLLINSQQSLSEENVKIIFSFENYYSFYYKISIISYLSQSQLMTEQEWFKKFLQMKGIQTLFSKFKDLFSIKKSQQFIPIQLCIINQTFKLLYEYFLRCFYSKQLGQGIGFLKNDADIDDKVEFLMTGAFPKSQQSIQVQQVDNSSDYQWKGQTKSEVSKFLCEFLQNIWLGWYQQIQKDHQKAQTFNKAINIILILMLNEHPQSILQKFHTFFTKVPKTLKLQRQFYVLVLSLCYYSQKNIQYLFIEELFKHITLPTITADYFKVLALLVGKFGLKISGGKQIPSVLFGNVLKQKNQLIIEGCARLLTNFDVSEVINEQALNHLWQNCLFGRNTSCKKEQTRSAIYDLILKLTQQSQGMSHKIIEKTLEAIEKRLPLIKITYSTEVNQRSSTGYSGLKNLGNICYMNSMIQQLFMNKSFRYLLMRINDGKQPQYTLDSKQKMVDDNILHQIQKIFGYLEKTTRIDFSPSAFCIAYKPFGESVNIMVQQDVQEFVSMFFDRLQSGIKDHPLNRLVENMYTGKYTNYFNCHQCKQVKKRQQNFFSLSLEVKSSKTLNESFNRFILGELINDYKCSLCDKKADVSKKCRVSKAPQILILHLQRIVFNLDTFINQKISSKHQFPQEFNLYPFSGDYYDKEVKGELNIPKEHPDYQYDLTGIICHIGNAEQGHYVSYSRGQNGKWYEFNDTYVNNFNPTNIETECFGGSVSFDDQYDWQKKQNSKNAYLLIYQKVKHNDIEMIISSPQQKQKLLTELRLKQVVQEVSTDMVREEEITSQEESSSVMEDSEKEKEAKLKMEMLEILQIRKNKSQDNIDVQAIKQELPEEKKESTGIVVMIDENVEPYIPEELNTEIQTDNEIHFFEKCLASPGFSKFFAKLLKLPHTNSQKLVKVCQKLTFGFWLKSTSFKELLSSLSYYIKKYPYGLKQLLKQNINLCNLLLQHTEIEVRSNIAVFLANSFASFIDYYKLTLRQQDQTQENQLILTYMDRLISMVPDTISKFWTKFNQYFQFWYQLTQASPTACEFLTRKQIVKHFADYFLDKKSPLKIYYNKPTIGSSYANPNFTMLLRTIGSMIEYYSINNLKFSKEERIILTHFDFIEKLIHDGYESAAGVITKMLCPNNLVVSEKIAIVLLKGMQKSNYESVQPYLDVLHEFVLIEDQYQEIRCMWVLGKPSLCISTINKNLVAMNSTSLEERIYQFSAGLHVEGGASLMEPIVSQNRRLQNFCMLSLQQVLKLCNQSTLIRKYIYSLGPPNYLYAKFIDFMDEFISRYVDDSKRMYGYSSSTGFSKEELGKSIKLIYDEVVVKIKKDLQEVQEKEIIEQQQVPQKNQERTQVKQQKQTETIQIIDQSKEKQRQQQQPKKQKQIQNTQKMEEEQNFMEKAVENTYKNQPEVVEKQGNQYQENMLVEEQFIHFQELNNVGEGEGQETQPLMSLNSPKKSNKKSKFSNHPDPRIDDDQNQNQQEEYQADNNNIRINVPGSPIRRMGKRQSYQLSSEEESEQATPTYLKNAKTTKQKKGQFEIIHQDIHKNAYHPAKFKYNPIEELNCDMKNVKIERHSSQLILVRTYPTGMTNKSFTSTYSHKKVSQRLQDFFWDDQKSEIVSGFFITNSNGSSIRVQTDDGCYIIRSLDHGWVWSKYIIRVWIPQRSMDWPKWSLYSDIEENIQSNMMDEQLD